MSNRTKDTRCFQLKGSILTLHVLHVLRDDIPILLSQLQELISRSPNYFNYAPLVIDLSQVAQSTIDYASLCQSLRELNFIPVGVRGIEKAQAQPIYEAGLALFPSSRREEEDLCIQSTPDAESSKEEEDVVATIATPKAAPHTLLITKPIRSGQQVYAQGGDLIVHATVSQGAELLADGNIHVYGPLRGRAMAGVTGNKNARIYCQKLEAELVSVAGHYSVNDDINFSNTQPMCIYLENNTLQVKPF
jgi:septum site-determining protein MinC